MSLQGKVAIVTGGSAGIGAGIVEAFRSAGATVVVADIDSCEGECVKTDVSSSSSVKDLFSYVQKEYGKVDIVVNNAGIYPFVSLEEMSEEDWGKVIDVNLKGVHLMSQEAAKILGEGGRIINISSIASLIGFEGLAHYCASKGGVNAYTRALALSLAGRGITVNAIAPGAIDTPGSQARSTKEVREQTIRKIPVGRYGDPRDIAHTALFFASEEASYVTGQVLVVDGGWTIQ